MVAKLRNDDCKLQLYYITIILYNISFNLYKIKYPLGKLVADVGGVMGLILGLNLFELFLFVIRSGKRSFAAFKMRVRNFVIPQLNIRIA